ncbi:hypothetical protein PQO03_12315 [Lentisphaera profundi]|uniref:ThuA-like domain-containing protein n=1 Tax=Lentisphaera profundi TaxID=1658616 RepID=A0ABY7W0R5_9BACT|nr:ThuA domain-containing protein [Lentisphaera profundi]WDE98621.1 hypothetical protein PQO03_12315 [Lentisphaera profundi]
MKYLMLIMLGVLVGCSSVSKTQKVLYVTTEPGKHHDYTAQRLIFEKVALEAGWDYTVHSNEHYEQLKQLADSDLTKGYDAVIYNFCFANSKDLLTTENLIKQTREKGTPAMVIHCSMHSFWATFKNGDPKALGSDYKGQAKADAEEVKKWKATYPDREFPVWGDFTGIASTGHGPKIPMKVEKCCEHEATKSLAKGGYTTVNAELYNNYYLVDGVQPLLRGVQKGMGTKGRGKNKKTYKVDDEAIIMWQVPQGKSEVVGLTTGHSTEEWQQKEFQLLIKDAVNYLLK